MANTFNAQCPSGTFMVGGTVEAIVSNFGTPPAPTINNLTSIECSKNDGTPNLVISVPPQSNNSVIPSGLGLVTTKLPSCKNGYSKLLSSTLNNPVPTIPSVEIGLEFTCNGDTVNQPSIGYGRFIMPPIANVSQSTLNCPTGQVIGKLSGNYTTIQGNINGWTSVNTDSSNCVNFIPPTSSGSALKLQESNDNTLYTLAILIIFVVLFHLFLFM